MTTLAQIVHANSRPMNAAEGEELYNALLKVTLALGDLCAIRNAMRDRGQSTLASHLNSYLDTIETTMDQIHELKDWQGDDE